MPLRTAQFAEILTPEALKFLAKLHRAFNGKRLELLERREYRQQAIDAGELPTFLPETAHVRADAHWKGPAPAPGLVDRKVEITGPVDRKMVINALNSGASTFMADFEDSNAPTWENNLSVCALDLRKRVFICVRASGTHQPPRRQQEDHLAHPGCQGVQAQQQDRHADRAPPRLASGGEAPVHRRRAHVRLAL